MKTEKNKAIDEVEIRRLMAGWVKAVRAKDVNRLMAYYARDILLFDLAPPLEYRGADAYRKSWEEWFSSFKGPVGYEIRDLSVTSGNDAAFGHSLNRVSGTREGGEETYVWVRSTMGFRKNEGKWLIAHEHTSVPFYMDGSDKASIDLEP